MKKQELSKKFKIIMTIITILYSMWFVFWSSIGIATIIDSNFRKEGLYTLIIAILMLIPYILMFIGYKKKSNNKKRYLTIAMIIEIIGIILSLCIWIMWPLIKPSINTNNHPCETCNIMKYDHE